MNSPANMNAAQNEMDTRVTMMLNRAFTLAINHLDGESQQFARDLHAASIEYYTNGPQAIKTSMASLIQSSSDVPRATAAAINLLVDAIINNTPHGATSPPSSPANTSSNNTRPPTQAIQCLRVMLDDARAQATWERTTLRPAPNTTTPGNGNGGPTPFYTTLFTPGGRYLRPANTTTTNAGGSAGTGPSQAFDQHARLHNTLFWHRAGARALPFPYTWPMTGGGGGNGGDSNGGDNDNDNGDGDWADARTVEALNRAWRYWLARLGYADPLGEHRGPWAREEREFVAGLMGEEGDGEETRMHDVEVVEALNAAFAGRMVSLRWMGEEVEVAFRARGVLGLREGVEGEGVAGWRRERWEREWEEDRAEVERRGRRGREEEEERRRRERAVLPAWLWGALG
ncbi:uncharacterized protein BKCO1_5000064 [Diplodia corticola]|uniref:Uncharacterized protein n=1 Tax=Diplodia corticola TaxID=236234 RepID=A0A1J9RTR4_9PEZI|nr:uncharacterized protein BKCO1_5000064 [Diplodia corticola]OJD31260.1 hypothetical protein BKCO1_5000064 [Diplodia corticola]